MNFSKQSKSVCLKVFTQCKWIIHYMTQLLLFLIFVTPLFSSSFSLVFLLASLSFLTCSCMLCNCRAFGSNILQKHFEHVFGTLASQTNLWYVMMVWRDEPKLRILPFMLYNGWRQFWILHKWKALECSWLAHVKYR